MPAPARIDRSTVARPDEKTLVVDPDEVVEPLFGGEVGDPFALEPFARAVVFQVEVFAFAMVEPLQRSLESGRSSFRPDQMGLT